MKDRISAPYLRDERWRLLVFMSGIILLVAGCHGVEPKPFEDVHATQATTQVTMPTSTPSPTETPVASQTSAPTPTTTPRVLNICLGAIPDTLYINNGAMLVRSNALEAIYDGPIDPLGFAFEPVILEKLPSLADGDARLERVLVERGDRVVDDAGNAVTLLEVPLR